MKKTQVLLFLLLFLSGCATYKFHKGQPPYDKGYVVSRGSDTIPEYTIGKNNSVPELESARERFKRRRDTVEYYYRKMGYLGNRFKQIFWDPPALFLDFIGGIFRMPFIAAADHKYEHDPGYREKIIKEEEKQDAYEVARIKSSKEELNAYIQKDLATEEPASMQGVEKTPVPEGILNIPTAAEHKATKISPQIKEQEKALQQKEKQVKKMLDEQSKLKKLKPQSVSGGPAAVIIAKPAKGPSPLKVQFYGSRSHSSQGEIVSYYWEFGDGDTSTKANPVNTYWSTVYGSKYFTATLTVKDDKGETATSDTVIEVANK